jgi:hypothetical protein
MQDTGNKMLAQKIFERGSALLQQQKFEQALVDLQERLRKLAEWQAKGDRSISIDPEDPRPT